MSDPEKLLAEATPLPWAVNEEPNLSQSFTIKNDSGRDVVEDFCHGCGGVNVIENAALIVYAVNHLPDYEAAVDALERLFDEKALTHNCSDVDCPVGEARQVLRRLRGEVPA